MGEHKIHFLNREEDNKVPYWNEAKKDGYRMSECGYQRKCTSDEIDDVTCKICLKEYDRKYSKK